MKKLFLLIIFFPFLSGCFATAGFIFSGIHLAWTAAKDQDEIRDYFFPSEEKEKKYFYADQPPWTGDIVVIYPEAQIRYRALEFRTEHADSWVVLPDSPQYDESQ